MDKNNKKDGFVEKVEHTVDDMKHRIENVVDDVLGDTSVKKAKMDGFVETVKHTMADMKHKIDDVVDDVLGDTIKKGPLSIGIIKAPFNKGQPMKGTKNAPSAIEDTGFIQKLKKDSNLNIESFGEVSMQPSLSVDLGPNRMINFNQVLEYCQVLAQKTTEVLQQKDLCITLGGDHSITLGGINGLADLNRNHQVKVLYIDAHGDLHTSGNSKSKDMHEMNISFLLDRETNRLDGWPSPCINPKDIILLALRDLDPAEKVFLENTPDLMYFTMEDIRRQGIGSVMKCCLEKLNPGPKNPLYISFDIDSLDPSVAPSTSSPVDGGLTIDEGKLIIQKSFSTGYLKAIDFVEVNPTVGSKSDAKKTAMAVYDLILSIATYEDSHHLKDDNSKKS